ncbi:zinc metalloprotease HtpX [bacterium]|nr:zinc metalloprotease HtpX [bacterium]
MDQTLDLFAQRRGRLLNLVHTWLLAAGSLLLLGVTAWVFAGGAGIVYALVFGAVSIWVMRQVSPQLVLSMYKAAEVGPDQFPAGHRIVGELARRADLPVVPRLYVVPSRMMNAFAVGRREESAIAITDALARNLTRRELAGVLAHEISHVAAEDVKVMAFADMVSRFTALMSTVGLFSLAVNLVGFAGGYSAQVPWEGVIVLLAAPTVGGLLQMALSRTREFDADLNAAALTGDPEGLALALAKLQQAQGRMWEGVMLPGNRIPDPSILRTHPRTEERVARLMALAQTGSDRGADDGRPDPRRRPSLVPIVRVGRTPTFDNHPLHGDASADEPAASGDLNPPGGRPRIRVTRGGVWW